MFKIFRKKSQTTKNNVKKSDVGKILETTDGYFNNRPDIKKPRKVVAVDQRKDDGALAVAKIYSKKGKSGEPYIDNLILKPKNHPSLREDSIVGKTVKIGVKQSDTKFKPIYKSDFKETNDRLTKKELHKVQDGVNSNSRKHKETYKNTLNRWHNHFKDNK